MSPSPYAIQPARVGGKEGSKSENLLFAVTA